MPLQALSVLVQIKLRFTLVAFDHAPENLISAFRAVVARLFILDPLFSPDLTAIGNTPQNHTLAHIHREIINMRAGEVRTFMTAAIAF